MSKLARLLVFAVVLLVGLSASDRNVLAQGNYVGTFALTNGASVKCLTQQSQSTLVRSPWAATPAQEWAFFLLPNGYFAIKNVETNLYLESSNHGLVNFQVDQSSWTGTTNQMWYLYPLQKNFYALVNAQSGEVLVDPNGTTANGTSVQQNQWTDNLNQWWYLYFLRM